MPEGVSWIYRRAKRYDHTRVKRFRWDSSTGCLPDKWAKSSASQRAMRFFGDFRGRPQRHRSRFLSRAGGAQANALEKWTCCGGLWATLTYFVGIRCRCLYDARMEASRSREARPSSESVYILLCLASCTVDSSFNPRVDVVK